MPPIRRPLRGPWVERLQRVYGLEPASVQPACPAATPRTAPIADDQAAGHRRERLGDR